MELSEAITSAVKYCTEHKILQPFLTQHSSEVVNMLNTEFNIDIAKEVWQEEAREERAVTIAKSLLEMGLPLDKIIKATGLPLAEIEALRQ
jgi:hypothetical protein